MQKSFVGTNERTGQLIWIESLRNSLFRASVCFVAAEPFLSVFLFSFSSFFFPISFYFLFSFSSFFSFFSFLFLSFFLFLITFFSSSFRSRRLNYGSVLSEFLARPRLPLFGPETPRPHPLPVRHRP
jgi:hypothetical protein